MDNLPTILVALLAAAVVGFIIYRVASRSGSSGTGGGFGRSGRPDRDTDPR
jgi:hypothetical protein